jgi:hypothetical protein
VLIVMYSLFLDHGEMDVDVNGRVVDRLGRRRMWREDVAV